MTKILPSTIDATLTMAERAAPFQMTLADNDPLPRITRCALEIIETTDVLSYVERAVPTGEVIETGVLASTQKDKAA